MMRPFLIFSLGLILGLALRPVFDKSSNPNVDRLSTGAAAPMRKLSREAGVIPQGPREADSEGSDRGYPIELPKD